MAKGYSLYVDGTITKPTTDKEALEWKIIDQKALGVIQGSVNHDLLFHIINCKESKEAWDKLKSIYGKVDEEKGFQIEDDLLLLDPNNFDMLQDYLTKVNEYRALLTDCGNPISDDRLIHHILKKLPKEYASFYSSFHTHRLTMGTAYTKPSFDSFSEILIREQSHLMDKGLLTSSKSKALVVSNDTKSTQGGKGSYNNQNKQQKPKSETQHTSQQGSSSSNKKGNNNKKEQLTCAYCKKKNHDEHHCKTKRIDELENLLKKNRINVPGASSDTTSKGKGQALMAHSSSSSEWILDSGASYHMGSSKDDFCSLNKSKVPHIFVGDDTKMEVEGKGNIEMENGEFQEVLYVPNLSSNLLSIYQITHLGDGHKVEFLPDSVQVRSLKNDSVIAVGKVNEDKRLYSFSHFVPKSSSQALLTHSTLPSTLWHERFGYLATRHLQQLSRKHMVKGLPSINFSKGDNTSSVDMHLEEKNVKGKSTRTSDVLQLVHMVLAGPFAVTSVSQGRYILTLVDDFSRFTWVYFLHHKNEVVQKLKAFKTHVERKSRKAIKVLKVDNENRYIDRRLKNFCRVEGIDLQNSPAFSPHKTDVAAMRIRTLKTMASCMIKAKSLDPCFEVEAISSASHILNRSPHPSLDGKTPFEAWCGRKPVVSHFRVFGCPAWANISSKSCKVPAPRPCTFIGYEDRMKAYRLMDPETHQIFVEKDVHFEESSPSLSSTPLHTAYTVETDSDFSEGSSSASDSWRSPDSCSPRHQPTAHAYIATVTGPLQQDSSSLPGLATASDLGDHTLHLPLLDAASSTVVTGVSFDPLEHSPHDQSFQIDMSVDSYGQQQQQGSSSLAGSDCSLGQVHPSVGQVSETLYLDLFLQSWISFFGAVTYWHHSSEGGASSVSLPLFFLFWMYIHMGGS